jgi:NADH-quinone oxidoreductase subunit J
MENLFFLFFKLIILIAGFSILLSKNSIQAILSLIIIFCSMAGIALLFGAEFLSFSFIIIYVGAVAILFLFVVMILNIKEEEIELHNSILGTALISLFVFGYYIFFYRFDSQNMLFNIENNLDWLQVAENLSPLQSLGIYLYFTNSLNFLICGGILLIALFGAIILTTKKIYLINSYINKKSF